MLTEPHTPTSPGESDGTDRWYVMIPHNLFALLVDMENPWLDDIVGRLGDIPALSGGLPAMRQEGSKWPQVRISYTLRLPSAGLRELGRELFVGPATLLDRRYGVRLESPATDIISLRTNNACLEWLIWTMQLGLLKARATFLHAAGIEINGKSLLFPSWGGVGKTAIVNEFVKNLGWRLLGDDLVILSVDGVCYGFPKPLVIYPYHRDVFPELFAEGNGPVAPAWLNSLFTRVGWKAKPVLRPFPKVLQFARRHNPQSVLVRPSDAFGAESLASSAQLGAVVWLDRVSGSLEPALVRADDSLASRIVGSTLREFDPWCVHLTNVACGLGILSFRDIYPLWLDIVERGLSGISGWMLFIPEALPVQDVPTVVRNTLERAGILKGAF